MLTVMGLMVVGALPMSVRAEGHVGMCHLVQVHVLHGEARVLQRFLGGGDWPLLELAAAVVVRC